MEAIEQHVLDLEKQIAVLQTELRCMEEARELQAREYERRLGELNHAHAQEIVRNAASVPRELWETRNMQMDKWMREIDRWRWVSIGAGLAGGGLMGVAARLLLR